MGGLNHCRRSNAWAGAPEKTVKISRLTSKHRACDCPQHRSCNAPRSNEPTENELPRSRLRWLGTVLSALACLLCPACVATWGPLLSTLGIGLALSEATHGAILVAAILASLTTAGWRAYRLQVRAPVVFAVTGAVLLAAAHWLGESLMLSGLAVVAFVLSALSGRRSSIALGLSRARGFH